MDDRNKLKVLKDIAQENMPSLDKKEIKNKAKDLTNKVVDKVEEVKETAVAVKDDVAEKLTELDCMLESLVTEYNDAYTLMNDRGVQLYIERKRAIDIISLVETVVNSIANKPKSFDIEFEEIKTNRMQFIESCEFAERELKEARKAVTGTGAGLAAGASVAFMAPTVAMWIATTFGTASTGTAISTLSGAAATNAALAWLGGGALAAGGHGMAAGNALLALAGPIGWSIAGATLLSSILIFTKKKVKLNKQKNDEIRALKANIERVKEMDSEIYALLTETEMLRTKLNELLIDSLSVFNADYSTLENDKKLLLGALINNTKGLSVMFRKTLDEQ